MTRTLHLEATSFETPSGDLGVYTKEACAKTVLESLLTAIFADSSI